MANNKERCGAKCRDGTGCKSYAMANGRCRMHGGKSLKGRASKTWKSGLYSKYAGGSLKKVLNQLEDMPPEELTRVDNELKLLQALIMKSRAIEQGTGDLDDLDTISKVIERLIKSKQRAVALRIEEERLVPADDIRIFLEYVETTLVRFTGHDDTLDIMNQLKNFKISDHEN